MSHRSIFVPGPAGRLEALLWAPAGAKPQLAAVVCHPHPLFGGTMHNKVVYQVARTLDRSGIASLRFNFRGVGLSAGEHDKGRGEGEDVKAVIDFLAAEFPEASLLLAGFSFGAWVGLRIGCADRRIAELIGLGAPVNDSQFDYLSHCAKPKLFITGENDQFGSPENLKKLVAAFPAKARDETSVVIVPGVDHFFAGKLHEMDSALADWLIARHPELHARNE
ncbi:MAG TPA: alpha/beta family hydrolase [Candidatus Acidoferrales bacterium]|nr:alpha/beta family hydrolase [Candidatus Acidoferrales bacterium]